MPAFLNISLECGYTVGVHSVFFLCIVLGNFSLEMHCLCTFSLSGFLLPDFFHELHLFLFQCDHLLLDFSMIGSVSCRADCLSTYIENIYTYILNVKLGMPVFYTCKVVSYLLVTIKRSANMD